MGRLALALLALSALGSCSDDVGRSLKPLLNRCIQRIDCPQDTYCDPDLGICAHTEATLPYAYRVQVTPTQVTDAGQLAVSTTGINTLTRAGELPEITLAPRVSVAGSVLSAEGKHLEAELVFTPRDDNALGGALSVFTRLGAAGQAFGVELEPSRSYDVLVYPRGSDSESYPPASFELVVQSDSFAHDFAYPPLVALAGRIEDGDGAAPPDGLRIKTRYRDRLLASSSIGTVERGSFEVFLPQAALDTPSEHELALDLSGVVAPQNVQILFDLSKRPEDGVWVMPVLPSPVRLTGTVEIAELANAPFDKSTVNAQLTFISDFPLPAGNIDQRQTDWCQLRPSGAPKDTFRCSAYVTTDVGPDLQIAVNLLPGSYQTVIVPTGAAPTVQRLATDLGEVQIESQFNGTQGPSYFPLAFAPQFWGTITSPAKQAMPSVVVSANALGVVGDLPEVALYNRNDRQLSQADGVARLAVDVGFYDLVAAPAESTGYAWVLAYNRRNAGLPAGQFYGEFTLTSEQPVLMRGSAVDANQAPVAQANVDAFALVPDISGGPDRAVRIAHTTTGRDGKFALQMPPRIGTDDAQDGGTADASVGLDAGVDAQQ